MSRRSVGLALLALFVIAPLLAVVIMCALLLFGVEPRLVFLPGVYLRDTLHLPRPVGVLATGACYWAGVVIVWLAARRVLMSSRA